VRKDLACSFGATSRRSVAVAFRRRLIPAHRGAHKVGMNTARRLLPSLIALAAFAVAGAPRAAEPEAVATAPQTASGPSVADQIDAYLRTSPAVVLPKDGPSGVTSGEEPRKVHGMVDIAVGSNGYRSAYVRSDLPVGRTGTLSIAVGETRFNGRLGGGYGRFGPGDRQSLGLALSLGGDAALDPQDPRCRRAGEERPDLRLDPRFEGGRPRACPAAEAPTSPQ
jgi:hypothetical protein